MSVDLVKLIFAQHLGFDWIGLIAKFIANYKKLSKANVTYDRTKKRLDELKEQWTEARRLRIDIEMEATEENRRMMSFFVQNHFSTLYYEASDFLIDELGKFKNASIPMHEDSTDSLSFEATKLLSSQLPHINFPKFSGEFSKWKSFRHTFEDLIGSNNKITNMLKLYYLKSCVSDAAAKLINNLSISDDNYSSAWKILMNEYENKWYVWYNANIIASRVVRLFSTNEIRESYRIKEVARHGNNYACRVNESRINNSRWTLESDNCFYYIT